MKLKKISVIVLGCVGFAMAAHANEVLLTANQPMKITFRIAHKNQNSEPIFEAPQSININKNATVSVDLNNYDRAGITVMALNDHELPSSINQFDQPKQCSMTTDKIKSTGALSFTLSEHSISCSTFGGVFG